MYVCLFWIQHHSWQPSLPQIIPQIQLSTKQLIKFSIVVCTHSLYHIHVIMMVKLVTAWQWAWTQKEMPTHYLNVRYWSNPLTSLPQLVAPRPIAAPLCFAHRRKIKPLCVSFWGLWSNHSWQRSQPIPAALPFMRQQKTVSSLPFSESCSVTSCGRDHSQSKLPFLSVFEGCA